MPTSPDPGSARAPMVLGLRDQTGARLYRRIVTIDTAGRKPKPVIGDPPPEDADAWSKLPAEVAASMTESIERIAMMRFAQQQRAADVGSLYRTRPRDVIAVLWRGDAAALQQLFDVLGETIDSNTRRRGSIQATPSVQLNWVRTPAGTCQVTLTESTGLRRTYSPGPGWWIVIPDDGEMRAISSDEFKDTFERMPA